MPDDLTPSVPRDPREVALDAVTAIVARVGRLLGNRITVEIDGEQHGYADGEQLTGRLSSVDLAQNGPDGGVYVWLSSMPDRVRIRRVVHEDAARAGIENTAGPKWLN